VAGPERRKMSGEPIVLRAMTPQLPLLTLAFVPFAPAAPLVPFAPAAPGAPGGPLTPDAPLAPGLPTLAPALALPVWIALMTSALRSRRRIDRSLMSPDLMSLMSRPVRLLSLTLAPVIRLVAVAVVAPTATLVVRKATHPALIQLFVQAAQQIERAYSTD